MTDMTDDTVIKLFSDDEEESDVGQHSGAEPAISSDPLHGFEFLAHEFILWLWFRSEHDFGTFVFPDGPVDLWFDDRLVFRAVEEDGVVSIFSGGAPSTLPEAKLSVLSGKVLSEARIGMKRGEDEWAFVLRAKAGEIQLSGIKIPARVKHEVDEQLYERVFLIDIVVRGMEQLFCRFFAERIGERWHSLTVGEMKEWLLGESANLG